MTTRVKLLSGCVLAALILLSPLFSGTTTSQEKETPKLITEKAQKSRGEATYDNIKGYEVNKVKTPPLAAPPEKTGDKVRGEKSRGWITIDNRTEWYIVVAADDVVKGTIGPYGDGVIYTRTYPSKLKGVAVFDDGSSLTWGPTLVYDTWRLTH